MAGAVKPVRATTGGTLAENPVPGGAADWPGWPGPPRKAPPGGWRPAGAGAAWDGVGFETEGESPSWSSSFAEPENPGLPTDVVISFWTSPSSSSRGTHRYLLGTPAGTKQAGMDLPQVAHRLDEFRGPPSRRPGSEENCPLRRRPGPRTGTRQPPYRGPGRPAACRVERHRRHPLSPRLSLTTRSNRLGPRRFHRRGPQRITAALTRSPSGVPAAIRAAQRARPVLARRQWAGPPLEKKTLSAYLDPAKPAPHQALRRQGRRGVL